MIVSSFLTFLAQILFVCLSIIAILDYIRLPNPRRRDFALLCCALGIPLGFALLDDLFGIRSGLLDLLGALVLFSQPYFLFRLLQYFRPSPPWAHKAVVIGMVLTWATLFVFMGSFPITTQVLVFSYCVIVDAYCTWGYSRGLPNSSGTLRRRISLITISSGLFTLAVAGNVVNGLLPSIALIVGATGQAVTAISAVLYYIGFVPPRWLRRAWQFEELHDYLAQTKVASHNDISVEESLQQLCVAVNRAIYSMTSAVAQWDESVERWTISGGSDPVLTSSILQNGQQVIERAWQERQPTTLYLPSVQNVEERRQLEEVGARTWLLVPIGAPERMWGVLIVLLRHRSLFIDDDLALLELFAQQCAIVLENNLLFRELQEYSEQLEQRVEERTTELRQLNQELEQRVQERTAHLTAINKELEAFSYSVSHDLRAPLRAVDGFSLALLEDYDELLDEIGRDFLHRIRMESQRMGQLIDDLIGLSHFTRMEMHSTAVDLSAIACDIVAELKAKEPSRNVTFSVEQSIISFGDERLIRVAMQNLLGNAWKFTTKQAKAHIEFGSIHENGATEYYVRDNGAGFNMAYANKLFGAFQRLHAMTEYEGTGIGLATVQRIIHRHGGSIRAEGEVNQGATFYFTLGEG